jgi:hypothetical protein
MIPSLRLNPQYAYRPHTTAEAILIAADAMNPKHRQVRVRPIVQSPVHFLSQYHPTEVILAIGRLGGRFFRPLSIRQRKNIQHHFKDWLGQFPKCELEILCRHMEARTK